MTSEPNARHEIEALMRELRDVKTALDKHSLVTVTDASGTILSANDKFCETSKWTRTDLVGATHRIVNSGHHPPEFFRQMWSTINRGQVWQGEIRNRAKDGTYYWLDTTIVPFLQASDAPQQFISIQTDITERKQIQTRLHELAAELAALVAERTEAQRATEARLRLIWETSPEGMRLTDAEGNIVAVNNAYCSLVGLSREQLEKHPLSVVFAERDRARSLAQYQQRMQRGAVPTRLEQTVTLWNDRTIFVEVINCLIETPRSPPLLLGVFRDVTARKRADAELHESEQRFRGIFDQSPIPILLTTAPDARIVEANAASLTLFGYTLPEVVGRTTAELGIWASVADRDAYFAALRRDGKVNNLQVVMRTKNGEPREMLCSGTVLSIGGSPIVMSSAIDITERVRAEAQRHEVDFRLQQSQKLEAIGTLAGGIAHDFNNILSGIMNFTALAQMDCRTEDAAMHDYLAQIAQASDRARLLVRQILTFSRQDEGSRKVVKPEAVLHEVLALVRSSLPALVKINVTAEPGLPLILADPSQIHQVILNLCVNAGQAIGNMPGELTLRLRSLMVDAALASTHPPLRPGPHVQLLVHDTGCGMDPATQARIFEPFFTTKKSAGGTGLGLSVVHGIIAEHNGLVAVRSEPGNGSEFEILLPAYDATAASDGAAEPASPAAIGHGEPVLIVDDEESVGRSLAAILRRFGYNVTYFSDPKAALATFWADPDQFRLVILDLQMPEMSGATLARHLLDAKPSLPVIIVSGDPRWAAANAAAIGIREVLMKPIDFADLQEILPRLLTAPAPPGRPA